LKKIESKTIGWDKKVNVKINVASLINSEVWELLANCF